MTSVPQTPDGKHIAVAKLVGAGFKPALVPQAPCSYAIALPQRGEVFARCTVASSSNIVGSER